MCMIKIVKMNIKFSISANFIRFILKNNKLKKNVNGIKSKANASGKNLELNKETETKPMSNTTIRLTFFLRFTVVANAIPFKLIKLINNKSKDVKNAMYLK